MDDLSQKIGEILGNPETMEQIKGLAGMLGQSPPTAKQNEEPRQNQPDPLFAGSGSNDVMNTEMLGAVMKLAPLFRSAQADDNSTRLLRSLKPFMHEERAKKIDGAIRLLGLMRMLPLLKNSGIDLFR